MLANAILDAGDPVLNVIVYGLIGIIATVVVYIIISMFKDLRVQDAIQTAITSMSQSVTATVTKSVETGHAERMEVLRTASAMLSLNQLVSASVVTGEQLEDLAQLAKDRLPLHAPGAPSERSSTSTRPA